MNTNEKRPHRITAGVALSTVTQTSLTTMPGSGKYEHKEANKKYRPYETQPINLSALWPWSVV
jgi:hypothetical protein